MAETRMIYGAPQTMAVSNLASLANNATSQWRSTEVSNLTNEWDDAMVQITLDFSNVAPANSQAAFIYVDGRLGEEDPLVLDTETTASSQPDATTGPLPFRLLARVPYRVTDQVVRISVASVAAAFGGVLPPVWRIIIVNHSGAALAASGHSVIWRGIRSEIV